MHTSLQFSAVIWLSAFGAVGAARADEPTPSDAGTAEGVSSAPRPPTPPADADAGTPAAAAPPFTIGGYAEANYSWNFNAPSNGITNYRGFDNKHNSFTISNVALDAQWDAFNVVGRLTLQVGNTPSTYYLAEPARPGASGANASGAELWKYLQQAYAGYRFGIGGGLTVLGGIFLSPIGPEGMAIKDNWNWSRSDLFFGLPFYHTGVRATYALTDAWALTVAGYNGWNSVVDNNQEKSVTVQANYTRPQVSAQALYFGGVERSTGAPEARAWRHLLDAFATWNVTDRLSLLLHGNVGFEPNHFGTSSWVAGALYARFKVVPQLYLAARGDAFYEHVASSTEGTASAIFWPVAWVASGTVTVDYRPMEKVSFRLEYRHDQAAGDMYFGGAVTGDGLGVPFVPNRRSQDTLTVGVTAWF